MLICLRFIKTRRSLWGCLVVLSMFVLCTQTGCEPKKPLNPLLVTKEDSIKKDQQIIRAQHLIKTVKKNIQSGDLVTRTGNDFTSESLRSLNQRNSTYSHCGIASIENDSVFVYHALGGEWNPDEKLRRDRWEIFADPYSNKGIGIFKPAVSVSVLDSIIALTKSYQQKGLMFDMDFDLKTNDRMYCAEFIYKVFIEASSQQIQFNRSKIRDFEFIGVDDIFLHPIFNGKIEIIYN